MTSKQERVEQEKTSIEQLQADHRRHEQRLEELKQKAWLTPEEEIEEKQLKKLKLQLKDRMAVLRRTAS
jgi:LPS O-antigen subunit length determinant protein (WzzB/FepE family)